RDAGLGKLPHRGRDVGRDRLSLRVHRPAAASAWGGGKVSLRKSFVLLAVSATIAAAPVTAQSAQKPSGELYQQLCSQCHGEKGDGQGVAAGHLQPRPRDFTAGKFKIRHTPSGA